MAKENEHIQLSGGRARVFREIRNNLEERLGYEPSKPRVFDELLENYDGNLRD